MASKNNLLESKKSQLAVTAPKKVDATTIRNRRAELLSEITKSRNGNFAPPPASSGSVGGDSVVFDDSNESLLINYHDLSNDIYVCDW